MMETTRRQAVGSLSDAIRQFVGYKLKVGEQQAEVFRRFLMIGLVTGLLFAGYLVVAWVVVMNTKACWWPWSDILPGPEELCSIGM